MLREIKNAIYCIASYTGNRHFVECDSEDELAAYVAEGECKPYGWNGFFITVMFAKRNCRIY